MNLISFDVETWGALPEYALQPYRVRTGSAFISSAAFHSDSESMVEFKPDKEWLRDMLVWCAANDQRIVGWNVAFDAAWLIALGLRAEVFACKWLDAMLLYRHTNNPPTFLGRQKYGLKEAIAKFLPEHAGYEKDVSFDPEVDPGKLCRYNLDDARHTLTLANLFLSRLPPSLRKSTIIEAACIPLVAESMVEGLHVNLAAAAALDTKLEEDANVAFCTLKLSCHDSITPEILASPAQLGKLLYDTWGLTIPKVTDKGAASTDKEALERLSVADPRANNVREYREAVGNRTKFVKATQESVKYNGDGCMRPQFRIFGTYSGRMTVSSSIKIGFKSK